MAASDIPTHNVFVSYHHANDGEYKETFCEKLSPNFVDKSVDEGDIDPELATDTIRRKIRDDFIADATVTVVLIGKCTWQRKHVDWEIGSSLINTRNNSRCGLVGILLPSHYDHGKAQYRTKLVPPRVADNLTGDDPYCKVYHWPEPWSTASVEGVGSIRHSNGVTLPVQTIGARSSAATGRAPATRAGPPEWQMVTAGWEREQTGGG